MEDYPILPSKWRFVSKWRPSKWKYFFTLFSGFTPSAYGTSFSSQWIFLSFLSSSSLRESHYTFFKSIPNAYNTLLHSFPSGAQLFLFLLLGSARDTHGTPTTFLEEHAFPRWSFPSYLSSEFIPRTISGAFLFSSIMDYFRWFSYHFLQEFLH